MNHRKKLETVLNYIINEEHEEAEKLLHQVIVEKSRSIYESLIAEEGEEHKPEHEIGDEAKDNFELDVKAPMDGENEEDEAALGVEEDEECAIEDRVDDLEASLAQLTAEFEELLKDEEGELDPTGHEMHPDLKTMPALDAVPEVDESMRDPMMEATEFLKKVAAPKNAEDGSVNKKSVYSKEKKPNFGGEPVDFDKGGAESGPGKVGAEDAKAPDNVDMKYSKGKAPHEKPSNEDKAGNKSPLSKSPRKLQ